jgi:poly(ADP-ribose) glycohydrolase ARH3
MIPLQDRFRGALLGCFVGDALGRPFEGAPVSDARLVREPRARASARATWMYTDDTEMMIGVAESLLRRGGLDVLDMLRTMAAGHDPGRGYGKGMRLAFAALARGSSPESAAWAEGSRGNGAAVRLVPLACLHHDDPDVLAVLADQSAAVTHAHAVARSGAALYALALASALALDADRFDPAEFVHTLASGPAGRDDDLRSKLEAIAMMTAKRPSAREVVRRLGNGVEANESVPLALFAFVVSYPSFEEVVLTAIEHGGDTDTIGAMAGALIGAARGADAIAPSWTQNLENAPRGRDHVLALADGLHALFAARRGAQDLEHRP